MKHILVLLLLALAGCAETQEATPAPQPSPDTSAPPAAELVLTLSPLPVTTNATVILEGSVSNAATISVAAVEHNGQAVQPEPESFEAQGAWSYDVDLQEGHTTFRVTADDGTSTTNGTVLAVRVYEATLQVFFRGEGDLRPDREDTVLLDPGNLVSQPLYDGCDVDHPGTFVVHDALMQWEEQTELVVDYSDCGQFGFGVNALDGYESPGFWCYSVDGEAAELGISAQAMGRSMAWDDCAFVLG